MKIILENVITIKKEDLPDNYKKTLKDFSIFYNEIKEYIFLEEQKIVLNEQNMNVLFNEFLSDYVKIEYADLGGRGCDFSLRVFSLNNK